MLMVGHVVLNNLKEITFYFGNDLDFKIEYRVSSLVSFTGGMASECGVKHDQPVGVCIKEGVYEIRVACWFRYLGQTASCFI